MTPDGSLLSTLGEFFMPPEYGQTEDRTRITNGESKFSCIIANPITA